MTNKYVCHNCDVKGLDYKICKNCHFAIYCDNQCYQDHHINHECCDKDETWSRETVKELKYDVKNKVIRSEIKQFLKSDQIVPSKKLKVDIINDLYIQGKIFQAYIKTILKTEIGRKRVADKIFGEKRYFTSYTRSQKSEIRDIVISDPEKYDPNEDILSALDHRYNRKTSNE